MREHGIRARHKQRYRATTNSRHSLPPAANVLDGQFNPAMPNAAWATDITYIATAEGWLYLAVVLDLFDRSVVGWSIKPRMTTDIVIDALPMVWFRRRPAAGLVHHSDRGSQYASGPYQDKLASNTSNCFTTGVVATLCSVAEPLPQSTRHGSRSMGRNGRHDGNPVGIQKTEGSSLR